jgi:hypothetical protein
MKKPSFEGFVIQIKHQKTEVLRALQEGEGHARAAKFIMTHPA